MVPVSLLIEGTNTVVSNKTNKGKLLKAPFEEERSLTKQGVHVENVALHREMSNSKVCSRLQFQKQKH